MLRGKCCFGKNETILAVFIFDSGDLVTYIILLSFLYIYVARWLGAQPLVTLGLMLDSIASLLCDLVKSLNLSEPHFTHLLMAKRQYPLSENNGEAQIRVSHW